MTEEFSPAREIASRFLDMAWTPISVFAATKQVTFHSEQGPHL